jgi:hypothetical protein
MLVIISSAAVDVVIIRPSICLPELSDNILFTKIYWLRRYDSASLNSVVECFSCLICKMAIPPWLDQQTSFEKPD